MSAVLTDCVKYPYLRGDPGFDGSCILKEALHLLYFIRRVHCSTSTLHDINGMQLFIATPGQTAAQSSCSAYAFTTFHAACHISQYVQAIFPYLMHGEDMIGYLLIKMCIRLINHYMKEVKPGQKSVSAVGNETLTPSNNVL